VRLGCLLRSRSGCWPGDLRLFRSAVLVGLQEVPCVPGAKAKQNPGRMLPECLRDREADVLRFLSDLQIPPTSNQAERDLRPAKTQQKISGRLRPEKAARDRYAIRGYASTAAKHGASALAALRDALAGNAWMRRFQRSPDPASRESRNATSNNTAEAA
jgi:transposase